MRPSSWTKPRQKKLTAMQSLAVSAQEVRPPVLVALVLLEAVRGDSADRVPKMIPEFASWKPRWNASARCLKKCGVKCATHAENAPIVHNPAGVVEAVKVNARVLAVLPAPLERAVRASPAYLGLVLPADFLPDLTPDPFLRAAFLPADPAPDPFLLEHPHRPMAQAAACLPPV